MEVAERLGSATPDSSDGSRQRGACGSGCLTWFVCDANALRISSCQRWPEEVFAALIEAESLVQWLPPSGITGRFERFDARPGGSYRLVLEYSDGVTEGGKTRKDADVVDFRFIEIVDNVKIVQAVDFVSDDPAFVGTMTMTWELFREPGGTRVEVRADDVPTGITPEDHVAGMKSSLANLASFVQTTES